MQQHPINRLICAAMLFLIVGQCEIGLGQSCGCDQACRCDLGARYYTSLDTVYESRKIPLIREPQIQRFGLTRSWFNRISVNAKRNEIQYVLLQDGTLFLVCSDARLHALDAETGTTLWVSELGPPDSICMAPAANSRMVAAVGGNILYVFDRTNGRLLWQNNISGVAGAGCALSERHVYVPLASGRILAWPLEEMEKNAHSEVIMAEPEIPANGEQDANDIAIAELRLALRGIRNSLSEQLHIPSGDPIRLKEPSFIPLECQSFGLALIQPVVATQRLTKTENEGLVWDELIAWPTVRGEIYFGCIGASVDNSFALCYQVRVSPQAYSIGDSQLRMDWIAPRELSCQLTYSPPMTLNASEAYHLIENGVNGINGLKKPVETEKLLPEEEPQDTDEDQNEEDDTDFDNMENTEDIDDFFNTSRSSKPRSALAQNFDSDDSDSGDFDSDGFGSDDEETNTGERGIGITPEENGTQNGSTPNNGTQIDTPPEDTNGEKTFELPSMVIGGSVTGFVVAIDDVTGEVLWKYVVGHPISQRMVVVKNHVYACAQNGGMYCLEALRGGELWFAPGIAQFVAESGDYIYCLNKAREIEILERKTGKSITSFEAIPFDFFIDNAESDRIYLATKTGLVQCLHETYLPKPLKHRPTTFDLAAELQAQEDAEKTDKPKTPTTPPRRDETPDWDTDGGDDWGSGESDDTEESEDDFFGSGFGE